MLLLCMPLVPLALVPLALQLAHGLAELAQWASSEPEQPEVGQLAIDGDHAGGLSVRYNMYTV